MAILKRRKPRHIFRKTREALWPSMGWRRTASYYRHRIFRTGDSTYKITAGLAAGAAVSWSPFLGTHFAQAIFAAWLLRASLIAGFIGTAWGNPWTFPFLLWFGYNVGVRICGLFGLDDSSFLPDGMDFAHFIAQPRDFMRYLFANPLQLLLPMTIGGYLCGLAFWPLAYAALYYPVRTMRKAYALQRLRRRRKKYNADHGPNSSSQDRAD